MLHDAAKRGDVEIPVFCYEPKLGEPVGACRMCLVEIEGIPKLQTSCSTPVRDGMVVHTRTDQVKHAQSAVVEFLLVNHPLDCPVCDKGGECPLQDISMGWGPGKSRMTDQKRHFEKPIELSPLVAIDRERCILCYRCVRFSQEVAEDEQLQLLERGDRTFVGTFDDRPYVAPFHGNITDLCPVGALTSYTYRFRARPWDIEQAGSVCTLCPSQCNVSFTVRDEQVKRVIARDNPDVDDGWLCDRGRYGFEMFGAEERVARPAAARRRRGELGGRDRQGRRGAEARRRRRAPRSSATPPTRRATWSSASCARRSARPNVDSRPSRGPGRETLVRLAQPEISARVRDIDDADAILVVGTDPLHSSPDPRPADPQGDPPQRRQAGGRHRGARRRSTAAPRRSPATHPAAPPPSSPSWPPRLRDDAGTSAGLRDRRDPARRRERRRSSGASASAARARAPPRPARRRRRPRPRQQGRLGPARSPRADQRPRPARGRLPPRRRPGLGETSPALTASYGANAGLAGKATEEIRAALESGELKTLLLFGVDPLRDFPDTEAWKKRPRRSRPRRRLLDLRDGDHRHGRRRLPARDPRRERRHRHASRRPPAARPTECFSPRRHPPELGRPRGALPRPRATTPASRPNPRLSQHSPKRSRSTRVSPTPTSAAAASAGRTTQPPEARRLSRRRRECPWVAGHSARQRVRRPGGTPAPCTRTYRDLWAGPITELNPPLRFLAPQQRVELSVSDAERLGLKAGDEVTVVPERHELPRHRSRSRSGSPRAVCFLIEGTADANANALLNGSPVSGPDREDSRRLMLPARRHPVRRSDLDHGRQEPGHLRGDLRASCR